MENRRGGRGCRRRRGRGCGACPARPGQTRTVARPSAAGARSAHRRQPDWRVDPRPGDGDAKTAKGATAGVVVEDVSTDSPAEKAGIRKGDVVVEFDGERVRSVRQLTRLVQETPAGRTVTAILQRDGQRTTVSVTPRDDGSFSFRGFEDLGDWARDLRYKVAPRAITPPTTRRRPATPPTPPMVWDRAARPRRTSRHLHRFALAAARRVLRHQGRGARHLGLRRFSRGEGRAEGRRRDHRFNGTTSTNRRTCAAGFRTWTTATSSRSP